MKRSTILVFLFALLALAAPLRAQDFAVKTNILYDATATVNLGVEARLAPKWTLEASANFNDWTIRTDHRWKHWLFQPELRYWLCEAMHGNFFGLELHGGQYNFSKVPILEKLHGLGTDFRGLQHSRYQGWFVGAGLTYGHAWMLAKHWNIEAEIGIGWAYTRFDQYPCASCGRKLQDNRVHNYVGPTKAALNLVYIF